MLDQLRALLRMPHKRAMLDLQGLAKSQVVLLLQNALLESGLAASLREGKTLDALLDEVPSSRPEFVRHVLDLAVALDLVELRDERYRLKSRLLRAVTADDGTAAACFLREIAHYHGQMLRELPDQIAGGEAPDYLAEYGDLVAGASRIAEPFLEPFIDRVVGRDRPLRILEIGCGSGVYLRRYAANHPGHGGIAIDFDAQVAKQAKENLEAWGIADRFEVLRADARAMGPELDGPFDLVTSYQNAYYFTDAERAQLFRDVHARLGENGRFVLVSAMSGKGFLFRYYDVLLNGTAGCHSLPTADGVTRELESAGFRSVERVKLLAGPGAAALIASA